MINYKTDKILAVKVSNAGTLTAIARSKKPGAFVLTDDVITPITEPGPYQIEFSPSRGKAALFAIESEVWRPHYPIVEAYFLNEAWPLGEGDLDYQDLGHSAVRYNYPEDSNISLKFVGNELTWQNSAASKRSFVLQREGSQVLFDALIPTLRLRKGIGGSLKISRLDEKGNAVAVLFEKEY